MDNRDQNVKCAFYRPGSKAKTTNLRVIGQRRRTIICQCNKVARHSTEFPTVEERVNHNRKFCKQCFRQCPIYQCLQKMEKEEEVH